MNRFTGFIVNHYTWFLFISIALILALIGYFVDLKRAKKNIYKIEKNKNELNFDNINVDNNVSLQAMVDKNKTINNSSNIEPPESL